MTSQNDSDADSADGELDDGTILRRGDDLYVVHETDEGPHLHELGNRRFLSPSRIPEVGDECLVPTCDADVVEGDTERRRYCSEGCLEWIRNYPAHGSDCPSYNCEDGTVIIVDDEGTQFERECTDCEIHGVGVIAWREAWWPHAKEEAVESIKEASA